VTNARKAAFVVAGYAGALLLAWGVTHVYVLLTNNPDRQSSAGMYAFGDSLVFLGVFAVAAIPATVALLYVLRSVPAFWSAASLAAIAIAVTAVFALLPYALSESSTATGGWRAFAPLRLLLSPVFGLAFFLALIVAPGRRPRRLLTAATAIELGAFLCFAVMLWRSHG
jgi:hypothetical protein